MKPMEALDEALSYKTELADFYEEFVETIEDRYLRIFVQILIRCEREDRKLLLAMIEAEEQGLVPVGADEFEADQEDEKGRTEAA